MNKLPARTGWAWFKQGLSLFRKQPAALTTLLFANILGSIAISAVPYIGSLLTVLLIPSLSMAFMQACLHIEHERRIVPAVLLTGFRKPVVASLCKVGLVYLGVTLLLALLTRVVIGEQFWLQMGGQIDPKTVPSINLSDLLGVLAIVAADLAILVALCFSGPLVCWQNMAPGKAIFYSFFAVLRSARPFVVLLLSWFALFFGVSMVLMLVFGNAELGRVMVMWVIFLFVLLLQCAIYAAYRQIFGVPKLAEQADRKG
jgi:hypothetical protein